MRLKALLKPSNAAACELGHVRCGPWPRRVIMQSGNDKTDHPRVRGGAYDLIFEEDTVLELHVRRVPGGLASDHWLFGTVAVGDRVDAIGPLGDFHVPTTEEDAGEPMVLIGGGTGLAPLVGIVRTALARHPERAVVLYHGVRDESDLYDRERFAELEASYAGFRFVPVLSDFASTGYRTGFPTDSFLDDVPSARGWSGWLCGPPPMVEAGVKAFKRRRMAPRLINREKFTPADALATA